jgi:hypothetical protein
MTLNNLSTLVAEKIAATHEVKTTEETLALKDVSLYYVELDAEKIEETIAENIAANIVANAISETELSYVYNIINLFLDDSLEYGTGVYVDYSFGVN